MTPVELVGAALALCASVAAGTVAHEVSHALVLRASGHSCVIRWRPDRDDGRLRPRSALASVTPRVGSTSSPTAFRLAALAPLVLALPLALALLGVVPDPFQHAPVPVQAALVGWLGCALPSPQDFAVVWYADRAIAQATPDDDERPGSTGDLAESA
ncbi:hypothetical protein BV210_01815 [Halorientalis sp. IM1011]|uniref:hypothetical protein n=1 Tax=Halorientalis sp. IM1011 TaxID=1932360 RepID=UPI00097CC72F|nr:hypothetical protein [Halorientalis sp. IM1011]AQL41525.1 hypothetical protein BV210_01815 [Halorientalis sp. IM1011]